MDWETYSFLGVILLLMFFLYKERAKKRKFKAKYLSTKKKYESIIWHQNLQKKQGEKSKTNKEDISVVISDEEFEGNPEDKDYIFADVIDEPEPDESDYPTIPIDEPEDIYDNPIFLPPPYENGLFFATDATPVKNSKTLYSIQNLNGNKGELYIDPDSKMKRRALQSPDTFLKWACEFENPLKVEFNDILLVRPGRVKLVGDSWKVQKKVKIQFK